MSEQIRKGASNFILALEELRFVWTGLPWYANELSVDQVSELMLAVNKVMKELEVEKNE
jgi:hypothetical protein